MANERIGGAEHGAVSMRRDGAICTIAIERPASGNAIDRAVRQGILRAMAEIEIDNSVRVVILTGAGGDAFSVGSDVAQLAALTPLEAAGVSAEARAMHEAVSRSSRPVIAAIKGPCIGAGLELALHADIRFARVDARFGLPSVTIGLPPSGLALMRLCQTVGAGPGLTLALTGGIINAERAYVLGLVSNVLQADQFEGAVAQLAQHLAGLSPMALRETKLLFQAALGPSAAEAGRAGTEAFMRCFRDGDVAQNLRTFYGGPGPDALVH